MTAQTTGLRIDKWLWFARFFKTRTLASKVVAAGSVRLNGLHVKKPSVTVSVGDTLTFPKERDIRVVKVLDLGTRRGPAVEAQGLYEDLSPPEPKKSSPEKSHPEAGRSGRPTKKLRRDMEQLKRNT